MTFIAKPRLHHPGLVRNSLGYTRRDYEGSVSTLCAGCGHDSISAAIIQAVYELELLAAEGRHLDALRVRAFPFCDEVYRFIAAHDRVFVVEQNRDAQLKTLIVTEGQVDPARFISILHYDGTPITARFVIDAIAERMKAAAE